jgi:Flp pilus assembly pilin Flp
MPAHTFRSALSAFSFRRRFGRFRRNADGVAAVEFGLLVPLLFVMFIGTLEIGQAVGLDRRVSMATASTTDLIAREKTASPASLDGVMQIIKHLLTPYDSTRLAIGIVAVRADSNNPAITTVDWSYGANVPTKCSAYPMPVGLLGAGATAIIVEGRYDYEPLLVTHFLNSSVTLQDKATVSPRYSCVDFHNNGCKSPCP